MKNNGLKLLLFMPCIAAFACPLFADDRGVDRESSLFMAEGGAPTASAIDYQLWDSPGEPHGAPTLADQRESGRFIVAKTQQDTWSVNERFGHMDVGQAIAIPQTNATVPQDLWSAEAGAGYNHQLGNGRDLGLNVAVGSDSNTLFYSIHETVFRVTANYRVPSHNDNAWIFFLTYSNNRYFLNNVPLPGAGYFFKADDNRLQGLVGFPFISLLYHPTDAWSALCSIFGPRNVNAEIGRTLVGPVRLYSLFQWNAQEWMIADRQDYTDRLFFDKKRAGLGLRSPLPHGFALDVSGGRQFDQRFFVNDSSSYKDVPTAGLAPTWFIQSRLAHRF